MRISIAESLALTSMGRTPRYGDCGERFGEDLNFDANRPGDSEFLSWTDEYDALLERESA